MGATAPTAGAWPTKTLQQTLLPPTTLRPAPTAACSVFGEPHAIGGPTGWPFVAARPKNAATPPNCPPRPAMGPSGWRTLLPQPPTWGAALCPVVAAFAVAWVSIITWVDPRAHKPLPRLAMVAGQLCKCLVGPLTRLQCTTPPQCMPGCPLRHTPVVWPISTLQIGYPLSRHRPLWAMH